MAFRVVCPKCGSHAVSVTRAKLGWGSQEELEMACRCGSRLFGPKVEEEVARQRAAWVEPPRPPKKVESEGLNEAGILEAIRGQIRSAVLEARFAVVGVDAPLKVIHNLWTTLGVRRGDDPATLATNRLEIDVATAKRLAAEVETDAADALKGEAVWRVQRAGQRIQGKLGELHALVARIPKGAREAETFTQDALEALARDQAEALARGVTKVEEIEGCACNGCPEPAAPGRKYCGDVCRKRAARLTYDLKRGRRKGLA